MNLVENVWKYRLFSNNLPDKLSWGEVASSGVLLTVGFEGVSWVIGLLGRDSKNSDGNFFLERASNFCFCKSNKKVMAKGYKAVIKRFVVSYIVSFIKHNLWEMNPPITKKPTWSQYQPLDLSWILFNSLAPGIFGCNYQKVIFNLALLLGFFRSSYQNVLRSIPWDLTDDKSTLVQVMAWCRQATSHYLSQCWPRSMSPYGVTRPQ